MDSNYVDKSRLPSRHVTEGPERAPHRSYLYAMGLTTEQIHQPLVGVGTPRDAGAARQNSPMRPGHAERAPRRSYLCAMGLTTEQIHQPLVGVATAWNEAAPCNISLMRQAQAVAT